MLSVTLLRSRLSLGRRSIAMRAALAPLLHRGVVEGSHPPPALLSRREPLLPRAKVVVPTPATTIAPLRLRAPGRQPCPLPPVVCLSPAMDVASLATQSSTTPTRRPLPCADSCQEGARSGYPSYPVQERRRNQLQLPQPHDRGGCSGRSRHGVRYVYGTRS